VRGKKLAGVLVEAQSQGTRLEAVIVGIGVNLGGELPAAVSETAITLEEAAGHIDRGKFEQRLLEHVEHWIDRYVASGLPSVNAAWEERMAKHVIARASTLANTIVEGEMAGLDGDGSLLLRDDAGMLHRVRSGTVESVLPAC
jgi:BirA family biotin operon repressor/biotin-[acetyl-CoA-carboxylase] ligase